MYRTNYNPEEKVWTGSKRSNFFHPNVSVGQVILHTLNKQLNKIGQINDDSGIALTNEDLKIRTIRIAQNLTKAGYKQGDILGIIGRNCHNIAPSVFAALLLGIQVNTLDPYFGKDDIYHMFGLTKPNIILCDADVFENIRDALQNTDLDPLYITLNEKIDGIAFIEEYFEEIGDEHLFIPPKIGDGSQTIALILCSSGTTGLSKGVCLSHAQILDCLSDTWEMMNDDILFCFSSLYWLSGAGSLILGTIRGCTRIITKEKFNPELFLKIIQKHKVTNILSPPSHMALSLQCDDIHSTDLSSVKLYMCGGSSLAPRIQMEFQKFLPNGNINCGYGMTEMGGIVTVNNSNEKLGSIGKLCDNISIKIIDDDGLSLGPCERGELCLKNTYTFVKYYGNPEETEATKDSEGWVHSGDIGYFDEDGFLYLYDRKKEILKYNNFQVSPSDIESIILQCHGVNLVCVVGVPDFIATDLPAALIVRSNNQEGENLTEQDIYDLVADKCSDYKKLRGGVYFVDALPMTPSGKFIKKKVKEIAITFFNNINGN